MKTIYLQRQGSSDELNTNNSINSQLGFFIKISTLKDNMYIITIVEKSNHSIDGNIDKRVNIKAFFSSFADVCKRIEEEMLNEFSEEICISETIERYGHDSFFYRGMNDKYLAVCFYEKSTETIRLYPQNYCLVSFKNKGTKDYLQMDAATAQYLPILEKQSTEYEKEKKWTCHKGKSEDFLRERFAWLIGEDIKNMNNSVRFRITDSLIK